MGTEVDNNMLLQVLFDSGYLLHLERLEQEDDSFDFLGFIPLATRQMEDSLLYKDVNYDMVQLKYSIDSAF